jgi:transcriptional regulator with XRE-family HTH domain
MNQPELGKKIAELRKFKGLTQEELVEKCNLNIRTLQRIESGKVTPRIYTLKLILTTLENNSHDSFEIINSGFSIPYWLEQFNRYFIDLFNLKTNTMKKITILSIMLSAIIIGIFALSGEIKAQRRNKVDNQVTDKNSSNQKSKYKMAFSHFSCKGCFDENDDMIGRDVKFQLNGVKVSIGLIKLNKKTREFNAGYIKGKLHQNKAELYIPRDIVNEGIKEKSLIFTADKVEQTDGRYILKGNAKMTVSYKEINDSFETDEIIIIPN